MTVTLLIVKKQTVKGRGLKGDRREGIRLLRPLAPHPLSYPRYITPTQYHIYIKPLLYVFPSRPFALGEKSKINNDK